MVEPFACCRAVLPALGARAITICFSHKQDFEGERNNNGGK